MNEAWISLGLAIAMAFTTRTGMMSPSFRDRWGFDPILASGGQYYRYFSCAFVHPDWWSYAINALMLFWFGGMIEHELGAGVTVAIYFAALGIGTWVQSRVGSGASLCFIGSTGGTSGVFFACLFFFPDLRIWGLPTWLFSLVYFIVAINRPSIGNCLFTLRIADLFGATVGLVMGIAIRPETAAMHPLHTTYLVVLSSAFIAYQIRNPLNLPFERVVRMPSFRRKTQESAPSETSAAREAEVNRLLDKIAAEGLQSLSPRERAYLEKASRDRRS